MFFFDLSSYLQTSLLIGKSAQYYHAIAEALVLHLGYQRGINLHGAPYDFRKAASKLLLFWAVRTGEGKIPIFLPSTYVLTWRFQKVG